MDKSDLQIVPPEYIIIRPPVEGSSHSVLIHGTGVVFAVLIKGCMA